MEHSENNREFWEIRALKGLRKALWLWKRFWYVRFVLNWAWEPDSFDFDHRVEHWGLFHGSCLLGGERFFFLDNIEESLQYRVPLFRRMITPQTWDVLKEMEKDITEVTRFLLFSPHKLHRRERMRAIRCLFRHVYTRGVLRKRPWVLAIGNEFTLQMLKRVRVIQIKVLGQAKFSSKNKEERRIYGTEVPHYAILINFLPSEELVNHYREYWWYEKVGGKPPVWPEEIQIRVRRLWNLL